MPNDTIDDDIRVALARTLSDRPFSVQPDPVGAVQRRGTRRRHRTIAAFTLLGLLAIAGSLLAVVAFTGSDDDARVRTPAPSQALPSDQPPQVDGADGIETLPAVPLDVRGDAVVLWTGTEVVVWGGDLEASNMGLPGPNRAFVDGAAYAPATKSWRMLASSPIPENATTPVGAATDVGVVIVRGRSTAVWNPSDNTWRTLDDAPASVQDLTSIGNAALSYSANARLDVRTGVWHLLPEPPILLTTSASITTTWTGRELVVIGRPELPGGNAAVMAYDPTTNRWRITTPPPPELYTEALSANWDGRRVVAVNYDMGAAAYDPTSDSWHLLKPIPARFYEWYPRLGSVDGLSAAFMGQAIVVLDRNDQWIPIPYGSVPNFTVAVAPPPNREVTNRVLFVLGFDRASATNVVHAMDLERMISAPRNVQVGIANVDLGGGASILDVSSAAPAFRQTPNIVSVTARTRDGTQCTIASDHGRSEIVERTEAALENDGQPRTWWHDAAGRRWQTNASADTFTIQCENAAAAETLAGATSFRFGS